MNFRDKFSFLSNMYPVNINMNINGTDYTFKNAEAAFQAQKDLSRINEFTNLTGPEAKALGRRVKMRPDWNTYRDKAMTDVINAKFNQHPDLMAKLKAIKEPIVEDNTWKDMYWGQYNGQGQNKLGEILMSVRDKGSQQFNNINFKVISGGQTGIDTLGLQIAKELGIPTGGTIGYGPNGYVREAFGPAIDMDQFNMTKDKVNYTSYPFRTKQNVMNSDGTVYFNVGTTDSRGFIRTRNDARDLGKPFLENPKDANAIIDFIKANNISTLNIAGNRGSSLQNYPNEVNDIDAMLRNAFNSVKDLGTAQMGSIKIIDGNIFDTDAPYIVHQVNAKGVMGAGLARDIRADIGGQGFNKYRNYVLENGTNSLGKVIPTKSLTNPNRVYFNLVGQDGYGTDKQYTDYEALKTGLQSINNKLEPGTRVAFPYGMGAGLGGGDWNTIEDIIKKYLTNLNVELYKFKK